MREGFLRAIFLEGKSLTRTHPDNSKTPDSVQIFTCNYLPRHFEGDYRLQENVSTLSFFFFNDGNMYIKFHMKAFNFKPKPISQDCRVELWDM